MLSWEWKYRVAEIAIVPVALLVFAVSSTSWAIDKALNKLLT